MCRVWIAGVSAFTNQSLTSAAATPAPARTVIVDFSDQRGGSCSGSPGMPERRPRSERAKIASSTPAQIRLSALPWAAAGEWNVCASVGTARIEAASTVSVASIRA